MGGPVQFQSVSQSAGPATFQSKLAAVADEKELRQRTAIAAIDLLKDLMSVSFATRNWLKNALAFSGDMENRTSRRIASDRECLINRAYGIGTKADQTGKSGARAQKNQTSNHQNGNSRFNRSRLAAVWSQLLRRHDLVAVAHDV